MPKFNDILNRKFSTSISDEDQLLLCCVRNQIDSLTENKIEKLVEKNLNWSHIEKSAKKNYVIPLVYNSLINSFPDAVPANILRSLKDEVDIVTSWNEKMVTILLETLALFKNNEIPVIPFKGVTFTLFIYGSLSLRPSADIDLLVHREDFLRAKDLLVRNGYHHLYFGNHEVSTVQSSLLKDDKSALIDLHYSLTQHYMDMKMQEIESGSKTTPKDWIRLDTKSTYWFFYLEAEPIWNRLDSMIIENTEVNILSLEDLLLVASINGIKENWRWLRRICDVAELVRAKPDINWDWVLGQVSMLRCERKFFLGLMLASRLLDMSLPNEIARRFESSPVLACLTIQTRNLVCQDEFIRPELSDFRLLQNLFTVDSFNDCVKYLSYLARQQKIPDQLIRTLQKYLIFAGKVIKQTGMILAYRTGIKI